MSCQLFSMNTCIGGCIDGFEESKVNPYQAVTDKAKNPNTNNIIEH